MSTGIKLESNDKWISAISRFMDSGVSKCPYCQSVAMTRVVYDDDGVGFATMECGVCNRAGYISRIVKPKNSL